MFVRLRVAWRPPQVLLAKWVDAWDATSSQVEGASTETQVEVEAPAEPEAHAVKAWKSIDPLS